MGEAKRRKQLDPNFGQPPKPVALQTVLEFAQTHYPRLGRGMVIYPTVKGELIVYVPADYPGLNDGHRAMIARYNPESEIVLNYPFNNADLDGTWVVEIISHQSAKAQLKMPREESK